MLDQIEHRGPDGRGVDTFGPCGFAHSRLAIIDLLSGHQPMSIAPCGGDSGNGGVAARCGPLHLIFNGEIYNHRDLRRKLEKRGHVFRSDHSDSEVLLFGYRQWGPNFVKHLHGMFAFAIFDDGDRTLLLGRDRIGKKPLYFRSDGAHLVFGSLPATLAAAEPPAPPPAPPADAPAADLDESALLDYLRVGYCLDRSLLPGVTELPAAHWMQVTAGGHIELSRYWQPPPMSRTSTDMGAVAAVDEVVREAVVKRLEADVPIGCFLSGGIDSSLVAAVAAAHQRGRGAEPLKTFSVRMPSAAFDETPAARAVAAHIGSDHTVLDIEAELNADRVFDDLERLMAVAGEPSADSSILPTYWLCRAAREHVKAAISGDGGDELFGGYDRYRALRMLQRRRAAALRAVPAALLPDGPARSRRRRLRRLVDAAQAGPTPAHQYAHMVHVFTDAGLAALMPDRFNGLDDAGAVAALPEWPDEGDTVHAAMRWDLHHYLPQGVLRKVDRASMAVNLEVRCPLLDTAVCDLAAHLPPSVLMPGGRPKGLLRQVAAAWVPASIRRLPKRGFGVPIGDWFRTHLRDGLRDRLIGTPALADLGADPARVTALLDAHDAGTADHTHRLFALLQLTLWWHWRRDVAAPVPVERRA